MAVFFWKYFRNVLYLQVTRISYALLETYRVCASSWGTCQSWCIKLRNLSELVYQVEELVGVGESNLLFIKLFHMSSHSHGGIFLIILFWFPSAKSSI